MLVSALKQLREANKKRGDLVSEALVLEEIVTEENKKRVALVVTNLLNCGIDEVNEE